MKKKDREIIEKFFAYFSPCHAIPRANEALAIKTIPLKSPILDLGCGDGRFALFTFGENKIEVGLDCSSGELEKARKSKAYQKLVLANASNMPFADESFSSVIANSVLEHVEELDKVLAEVFRILKKEGIFVLTVPTPKVSFYQFWSGFIPGYAEFKRKFWRHINYFEEEEWQKRLRGVGFKTILIKRTNSKNAVMWADIFFPLALIGSLKWVVPFLLEEKRRIFGFAENGATLVIVAKKTKDGSQKLS